MCLLFITTNFAQKTKIISGVIFDETSQPLPGVSVIEKGTHNGSISNIDGSFSLSLTTHNPIIQFSFIGYKTQEIEVKDSSKLQITLQPDQCTIEEVVAVGYGIQRKKDLTGSVTSVNIKNALSGSVPGVSVKTKKGKTIQIRGISSNNTPTPGFISSNQYIYQNNEDYVSNTENKFNDPNTEPLSTFSVDVDKASYANIRRFINQGILPPADAVRIEEMINYFNYEYDEPKNEHPFAIHHELAKCPWNESHYLMKVALQGKRMKKDNLPPSNLVFLLDVSGSMNAQNKLPLLKSALKMLVNELRPEDKVSIVVYAGAAGVVLEPTDGNDKQKIYEALDNLNAGGSTAGGAGLKLAYNMAHKNFLKGGNNRIILATDGDFNIGVSTNDEMEKLIEAERDKGIYITVTGFGMGNYKDSKMEIIADKGNGNYFYIDNLQEARKALVEEFGGTLFTIAKDVKFQLEFNPQLVAGYRLIGYENRLLNKEDFNDDQKDAGEIGSGHTVTALYEIIPVGAEDTRKYIPGVDALKYQKEITKKKKGDNEFANELLTMKLRYKKPNENNSTLMVTTVKHNVSSFKDASNDFRFVSSVAAWGMKLKNSKYIKETSYSSIIEWAKKAKAEDEYGYKGEMIRLMQTAQSLSTSLSINN